jgi:ATP-dependent Clp protease protease subunit
MAKTELENYLTYGVDEQARRIFFGASLSASADEEGVGAVTQCSIEYAIRAIYRLAASNPKTPIEIHMNSYGGDPYAMLALYDTIQSVTCQIKFYGKGAIMSAATWIMAGCDERYLYPNATVMVHEGWEENFGTLTGLKIDAEESQRLQSKLEEIYAENSRMPKNFWTEVCKRDLYLTAEEAVYLGLADRIVAPSKRGSLRKVRQGHLGQEIDAKKLSKFVQKLMKRIHVTSKIDLKLNAPKVEPVDERLTIEPLPAEPELTETKDNKGDENV